MERRTIEGQHVSILDLQKYISLPDFATMQPDDEGRANKPGPDYITTPVAQARRAGHRPPYVELQKT